MKCLKCGKELTTEEEKFAWIDSLCKDCFTKHVEGYD